MPGTYSRIYIQIVFAVKGRKSLIQPEWETEIHKYISGIVKTNDQKMIAINGMADHIHFLIGMRPNCCLSDLVRDIKRSSNGFVNDNKFTRYQFEWQSGYGAFSYGHSALDTVIAYIRNQKKHHQKKSFREEYQGFLSKFNIPFKDEYLFDWIE